MIAVDTNILIYAHRGDSDWHSKALPAVTRLAECGDKWAIPWPCAHEFLAIVTHPRIYDPPTRINIALECIATWFNTPGCIGIGEGPTYFNILTNQIQAGKIVGGMVHDAHIAALCIENGINALWTIDRDFSRFPKLKTAIPWAE